METKGKKVLIADDEPDILEIIGYNLRKEGYDIHTAKDGEDALVKAKQLAPDLVILDIMMPKKTGVQVCEILRSQPAFQDTLIIFLTALSDEASHIKGFETGADDYITKPFNVEILQSRIRNLIHLRELYHKDFGKHIEVKASHINITSMDEKLIQKAIKSVEDHITEPDFSVEDLSHELGMSRVYLYKKLLSLTGKSPLEFIRTIRLQQAAQLLEKSQLNVSEVAYKVGFNNPKYFAKCFKEEYKMLPSAYASSKKE